jgi:replicative DNA helicase
MTVTELPQRDPGFERMPPNDTKAEQAVLGGMLLSADAIADVAAIMKPGDHFRPAHQIIHEVILRLYNEGQPADPVTVNDLLAKRGEQAQTGGGTYLHTLISAVATAANAGYYARIVKDHKILRDLIEAGTRAVQLGYEGSGEAADLAARAQQMMDAVTSPAREDDLPPFHQLLEETIDALSNKAPRGLRLPWLDLDAVLIGLAPGTLTVVGARPGVGKSVVTVQIAAHTAIALGKPALLVSAEMSAQEITARLISAYSQVPLHGLLSRYLPEGDWDRISDTFHKIADAPLVIDDTPGATIAHIRGRLRQMSRATPAAVLCVDYLQLLDAGKAETRERAIAELSWGLKTIAREYDIPVIVAAQLNRQLELRSDKRPQLSDLRESGALEANADVVLLLHREDVYERESPRMGEIDMIVAKNRQGPLTTVTAAFQGHLARVADMAVS